MFGFGWSKKKEELKKDNVELARLVNVLFRAIEDGNLSQDEVRRLREEAYNIVIKYNL